MAERQSLDGMEKLFHGKEPLLGRTDENLLVTQRDLEARMEDLPESSLYRQRGHAQRLLGYVRFEQLARGLLDKSEKARERGERIAFIENELGSHAHAVIAIEGELESISR